MEIYQTSRENLLGTKNAHKLFCANFLNTPRGLGHPGKIPGTFQIPLFETQGRQTFAWGRAPTFWPPPLRVEDPHPNERSFFLPPLYLHGEMFCWNSQRSVSVMENDSSASASLYLKNWKLIPCRKCVSVCNLETKLWLPWQHILFKPQKLPKYFFSGSDA